MTKKHRKPRPEKGRARIRVARGGCIILDESDHISLKAQAALREILRQARTDSRSGRPSNPTKG